MFRQEARDPLTPRPYRLGRRQRAVDRTRARILAATRALLVGPGTVDLSIDAIARRAGVTRATVYQRCGSRPKLLEALFDDLAREGGMWDLARAFREPEPERALARFIATFGGFWTAHRAIHRRLQALGVLDAGLGRALAARQEWRRRALTVLVGRFPAAHPPNDVTDLLFTLTSFHTFDELAGMGRTPADVAPLVLGLARAVLGVDGHG